MHACDSLVYSRSFEGLALRRARRAENPRSRSLLIRGESINSNQQKPNHKTAKQNAPAIQEVKNANERASSSFYYCTNSFSCYDYNIPLYHEHVNTVSSVGSLGSSSNTRADYNSTIFAVCRHSSAELDQLSADHAQPQIKILDGIGVMDDAAGALLQSALLASGNDKESSSDS